jgi:hypothetical protein
VIAASHRCAWGVLPLVLMTASCSRSLTLPFHDAGAEVSVDMAPADLAIADAAPAATDVASDPPVDVSEDIVEVAADVSSEVRPEGLLTISPTAPTVAGSVGVSSAPIRFTLGNSNDYTTGVPQASITGINQLAFAITRNACVMPLPPLGTCEIEVTLTPRSANTHTANLVVSATPGGMVVAPITGTAIPEDGLAVEPNPLDLGSEKLGSTSPAGALTVLNRAVVAAHFTSATVTPSDFVVVTDGCSGTTVEPLGGCRIEVTFRPTAVGKRMGILLINSGGVGQAVAQLVGTGL